MRHEPNPHQQKTQWDGAVADYEDLGEPFTRQYAEAALRLIPVGPGNDVLDVAAGPGTLSLLAARTGANVLGTDFSGGMAARLAARFATEGLANGRARAMDGQALDLPDDSFDAAFAMFGIMIFPDWRRGLAELARVTRPGGRGCVGVWTRAEGAGPAPIFDALYRTIHPEAEPAAVLPGVARLMHADAFAQEMEAAGFTDVVVHTVGGAFAAPSAAWMAENMDTIVRLMPLYKSLDPIERIRIREMLPDALRGYETAEGLRIPSDAHIAVGRR